jgi:hypothetical protein
VLRALTRAESAPFVFAAALGLMYGAVPLALSRFLDDPYYMQLATLAAVAVPSIIVGALIPLLDPLIPSQAPRFPHGTDGFLWLVWGAFGVFVLVACVTAERIPLLAALQGADADTLVVLRERFLKAREGWETVLVYVNAALAGALVPYSLMLALVHRHPRRWILFGAFLLYCVSFVEKAYFLKAAIPLTYLVAQQRITSWIRPRMIMAGAAGMLALVTIVSGVGGRDNEATGDEFFSAAYAADNAAVFLVWRAVAIPLVTAADTLRIFEDEYGGQPLLGASSSLLAGLLGRDRVNIETQVFAAQWGQTETESGSSNSAYLTEAFLNFGYPGVVVFSMLIGAVLRVFARSKDEALRSLWMLFCFAVFVAPFTGTLFSNGFLLVIGVAWLLARRSAAPGVDAPPSPTAPAGAAP